MNSTQEITSLRYIRIAWMLACATNAAAGTTAMAQNNKAPVVPTELTPEVRAVEPGVKLTLLAEHPQLVTPTGIDIDERGQIWLAACHTHFRPDGYPGPEHDEILVFDKDGKNRRLFYNKTDATMHVEVGKDGWVYLAERDRILRVKDSDGDGVGDIEENLATLDTAADYPHNGLSGMAWHPGGGMIFSLGENYGQNWTLTARDGSKETGRGEGGVFWCTTDGTKMRRIARGFWNPFGLCVRADGEIFAAENDPGSRPPCRLLNIVEGADYGFQWVYGSSAIHPFVAWNGELRGTLGMVHPIGEGPCAVVELGGGVLIPSWSNHTIDYFPLNRSGAGFTSSQIEIVRGGENFRPVCMAAGPDGAFYFTDWVFSSYQLHARGRLWKMQIDQATAKWIKPTQDVPNDASRLATGLRDGSVQLDPSKLFEYARGSDGYLSDAALTALARVGRTWSLQSLKSLPADNRVWALVALRRIDLNDEKWVRSLWNDSDPEVRFECLRWIADAVLTSFTDEVEQMLNQSDLDYRLFEATLATWNTLRGKPGAGVTDPEVLVERVLNSKTPPRLKGLALRLVPAPHPKITVPVLRELLADGDSLLSLEVVRSLALVGSNDAFQALAAIAQDGVQEPQIRAEAIAGLANSSTVEHATLLLKLASEKNSAIRNEALRSLRFHLLDDNSKSKLPALVDDSPQSAASVQAIVDPASANRDRPAISDIEAWTRRLAALPGKPDAEAGRRVFFHSRIASCSKCHRHSGRGNVVGPDLSLLHKQGKPDSVLRSLLDPNRDVAPQFYSTVLELADGTIFSGILLRSSSTEVFRDPSGKERSFQKNEIVSRKEQKISLMPTDLVTQMTDYDLRDLLAFLNQ